MQHEGTPPDGPTSHVHVFAYGSNLFLDRMVGRVPSARVISIASLPRYRLRFHMRSIDGSGKADAHFTGDPGDRVEGAIYRMAVAHLEALDRCESGYSRKLHRFRMPGEAGATVEGWTYHALPSRIESGLRPFAWYHRYVVEGARHHGIAPAYVKRIERLEALVDPIGEMERKMGAVVDAAASVLS